MYIPTVYIPSHPHLGRDAPLQCDHIEHVFPHIKRAPGRSRKAIQMQSQRDFRRDEPLDFPQDPQGVCIRPAEALTIGGLPARGQEVDAEPAHKAGFRVSVDSRKRRRCWRREALKRCVTAEQRTYVQVMYRHMNVGGEWFAGRQRRAGLLPPARDPLGRGRPNRSGHLSLVSLDKLEDELIELQVLAPKPAGTTNGKLLGLDDHLPKQIRATSEGFRAYGIKVLRSANSLLLMAIQRYGFYASGGFRRSKSGSVISREAFGRARRGILEEVLSRFKRKRRGSRCWVVSCPCPGHGRGHGDRNPSLALSEGADGKLLWHCFAGCHPLVVGEILLRRPVGPRPAFASEVLPWIAAGFEARGRREAW